MAKFSLGSLRASFGVSSNEVVLILPKKGGGLGTRLQEAHCINSLTLSCKFASESPLNHNHGHPGTVSHYG